MSAILNSLNVHNFPIYQPILMKRVSKFMVYRALSDKTYLLSGLLSPLKMELAVQRNACVAEDDESRGRSSIRSTVVAKIKLKT